MFGALRAMELKNQVSRKDQSWCIESAKDGVASKRFLLNATLHLYGDHSMSKKWFMDADATFS